ncbi:MAG TPA: hypothetical protein DD379_16885 [Cyanobacteria bacterium UBA11162]|nr:hypothetical protein [Cyanobacteria bacterium UBA12227]HAX87450.1 hypothetical protein [Cyanobacteria bacterium UBA11370]HBL13036.1 hypothetical protein [Cyanobacteria bacterium UBA11162]HBY77234.1 hypothetical protein [Cyanobacteria bacterium UBA11148]
MEKTIVLSLWLGINFIVAKPVLSLPPPEDVPEEILRTEIITEARSPIDGKPLTAAEYAELQAQMAQRSTPPALDPEIQHIIFLLRVRSLFRTLTPF